MNWKEPETRIQLIFSMLLSLCAIIVTISVFYLVNRNKETILEVKRVIQISKTQSDINRQLIQEIREVKKQNDTLKKIADKVGVVDP